MDLTALILAALKKANTANERIDNLPEPMVFKGTLGTGGTIESLPTASTSNKGFTYIVITDGTYAGTSAKAGDMFISDGSTWVLVPSSDEPSVIDDSVTSTALTWSSSKIDTAKEDKHYTESKTLTAGQTSITFTNAAITADSAFSYWTSIKEGAFGISPTDVQATAGSLTLTFPVQSADMIVKVEVV